MSDHPGNAASHAQADHRQLGRLSGTGFAAQDDHLVLLDGGGDFVATGRNGQFRIQLDGWQIRGTGFSRSD